MSEKVTDMMAEMAGSLDEEVKFPEIPALGSQGDEEDEQKRMIYGMLLNGGKFWLIAESDGTDAWGFVGQDKETDGWQEFGIQEIVADGATVVPFFTPLEFGMFYPRVRAFQIKYGEVVRATEYMIRPTLTQKMNEQLDEIERKKKEWGLD